jgi:transcriptional regulator with PAS, ATPase and Fis domain
VITITLPPLRERKEDIPLLVDYFIKESSGKGGEMIVSENALRQLTDYNYPGNVRELRNIIERALTLCEDNLITYKDLPQEVVKEAREDQAPSDERKEALTLEDKKEQIERETIVRVLKRVNGNKFKAAKILNISRSTLYAKIEKLRIEY